ncbi:hypothetical protein CTAYLR_002208 [Chrysophaeum taylorii]|uniref:Pirin N-terminal domain-containing protein n=1 Tax=Chrysophaeum taylorii TaxID=2483200 RepID=A0AAD7UQJ4_9STRA|nr:hypothetical protein CTAYLR_002208 [Chrysophaeum taylorii]
MDTRTRPISARVGGTTFGGPGLYRLVGTVDVHGKGTLHPLHDVDPIVLMDQARITGKGLPKFGVHPHYGLIACSVVIDGALVDEDNLGASPGGYTSAGSVYCAASGRGIAHAEETADEENFLLQVIVRIPAEKMHLRPTITKARKDELPTVQGSTLLVGELDGIKSPATPDSWPDAVFLRVTLDPGESRSLALPENYPHGCVRVLKGAGRVAGQHFTADTIEVAVFGKGGSLEVAADDDSPFDVFLATGQPMLEEPWVKKLGASSFYCFIFSEATSRRQQRLWDFPQRARGRGDHG